MRTSLFAAVAAAACSIAGCSADAGGDESGVSQSRQQLALNKLESFGLRTDDAKFHVYEGRELVLVEGDMNFDVQAIIDGEYDQSLGPDRLVEKGFKTTSGTTPPVSNSFANNIKLIWATGSEAPTSTDMTRFRNAGAAWMNATFNGQTASHLSIREANTGQTIKIHRISWQLWQVLSTNPCGDTSALACANYPVSGKPGTDVWFKDDIDPFDNANQCDWTTSLMAQMARHELGHTIGFMHIGEGTHVDGTSVSGYATVMSGIPIFNNPPCTSPFENLQNDDLDTVTTVY